MQYFRLLIILILFVGCERDIPITDFSDDYSSYESQIKFEAIIMPDAETALVRADQVARVDDVDLFDCEDNDDDWNYYYCETTQISYESKSECESADACNSECSLHLYQCLSECDGDDNLLTYATLADCKQYCDNWPDGFCLTDDVGSDGQAALDADGDGNYDNKIAGDIPLDEDGSEGNGEPDCNEPRVDEYDETLQGIHLELCDIVMYDPNGKKLQFTFSDNASSFFTGSGYSEGWKPVEEYYYETVNYGAYIPDLESDESDADFDFQNYNGSYQFEATCPDYGTVSGEDSLYRTAKFISDIDSFSDCVEVGVVEDCMASESIDEVIFNDEDCPGFPEIPCVLTYVSLPENTTYHLSQYEIIDSDGNDSYDISDDFLQYIHGHRAAPYIGDDIDWNSDTFNFSFEAAIGVPEKNYAYTVFSFSPAYRDYYYYSTLSLDDSERSNLRDENGNPAMGFFGGLSSHTVKFIINITD